MERQQRRWQVRRMGVPMADGQQRWDRAYQLLLQWAVTNAPAPAQTPAPPIPPGPPAAFSTTTLTPS